MLKGDMSIVRSLRRLQAVSNNASRCYSNSVAQASRKEEKFQQQVRQLGEGTMESPAEFCASALAVKNTLVARPAAEFARVKSSLMQASSHPDIISMLLHTHLNNPGEQYKEFVRTLLQIIRDDDNKHADSVQYTMKKLYATIYCQRQVFPTLKPGAAIVLPDEVHKWFYRNIEKSNSFQHYYFLIQNDISLSSSTHIRKFTTRLLQGSATERELATFEYFLKRPEIFKTKEKLAQKFVSLHSFYDLYTFTNIALNNSTHSRNNTGIMTSDHITFYLQAVLQKIVYYKAHTDKRGENNDKRLAVQFVKLVVQLLMVVSKEGNVKQFTSVLSTLMAFMKSNPNIDHKTYQKMMHKPIICMFSMLQRSKNPDAVFSLAHHIGEMDGIRNSYILKTLIMNQIIRSLRYFNDPKITCQFLISASPKNNIALVLNELGIWGTVFHSSAGHPILIETVERDVSQMTAMIPSALQVKSDELSVPLAETYRTVLSSNAVMMKPAEYREFFIQLYSNYIKFMEERAATQYFWKHDTVILKCFISSAMVNLRDKKLILDIILNFYSKPFSKKVRNYGRDDPFAMVLYNDQALTQEQVSTLLRLMDERNIPLTFKLCSSMVFRYLGWGDIKVAHDWYRKILESKFPLTHAPLLEVARHNKWELPESMDNDLLQGADANEEVTNSVAVEDVEADEDDLDMFIDEQDESADKDIRELFTLVQKI